MPAYDVIHTYRVHYVTRVETEREMDLSDDDDLEEIYSNVPYGGDPGREYERDLINSSIEEVYE